MLSQATSKDNQVIIVSEPSAEATRRVRTRRYTPTLRRSSTAPNDTPGCADAQPISVHTEVLAAVSEVFTVVFASRTSLGSSYVASLRTLQPGTTKGKQNHRSRHLFRRVSGTKPGRAPAHQDGVIVQFPEDLIVITAGAPNATVPS
jgi:hypothetical protein